MKGKKGFKIILNSYGNYLGMEKGCIVLRDKEGNEKKYPLVEDTIGEVVLNSGNTISTGVLVSMAHWGVDVLLSTRYGRPVAILKDIDDDMHVDTRICQYEAIKNGKGRNIARQIVMGKIEGQNNILRKYELEPNDSTLQVVERVNELNPNSMRKKLMSLEAKHAKYYFRQVFKLFPREIRPHYRASYNAYDGANNMFNLAYRILFWKCYKSLSKSHLEPYLGFLHNIQFGQASLVCDFMEIYRHLVDGFLIEFSQELKPTDFIAKSGLKNKRLSKRVYLNDELTSEMVDRLFKYFQRIVDIPRVKRGKRQKIDSLITEEAFRLGRYLRVDDSEWVPRIALP
ncbi:MAG: CRISPR-associated endonuclease Cas1 [Candidatus Hodarchaeales archaeon]